MDAHAHLRLVESTGEVVCARCETLRQDLENIEKELRRLRAVNSRLQGERHQKLQANPRAADAQKVYLHYRNRLQPKAREKCPDDRFELILARLKAFSVDELCAAIDGAVADAFVDERGKRHDSLELIFRNTGKVYDFIGRAARTAGKASAEGIASEPRPSRAKGLGTRPDAPSAEAERSDGQTKLYARDTHAPTDVRGAFTELGIRLGAGARNVAVSCFASPEAHRREDRNRSCSVNVQTGAWCCHGCGAAGGVYHAALAVGRQPGEAMGLLERYGLVAGKEVGVRKAESPKEGEIARARDRLAQSPDVLGRLEELRGWSSSAVLSLGLGLADGRVVFPVRDAAGRLVGVNRYAPNPARRNGPKMMADPGSTRELFPAPETLAAGTVWLVEGEPDAVAARTLGLSACAVPGVQGWRAGWAARFERRRVVVCMDADRAGRECAARIAADLTAAGVGVVAVDLAPGCDSGYDLGDVVAETTRTPAGRRATAGFLDRLAGLSEAAA